MFQLAKSLLVSTTAFVSLMAVSPTAEAADITKKARSGDVASEYTLEEDGDLFRQIGKHRCQITTNVQEFKISKHPGNTAMIYFVKNDDLYVLHNAEQTGQCPKANRTKILDDVAKVGGKWRYTMVNTTKTTIVSAALSSAGGGTFTAWNNDEPVLETSNIENYLMNVCYGTPGKRMTTYVAFLLTKDNKIVKVRGKGSQAGQTVVDNTRTYESVQEFKQVNKVCTDY